MSMTYRTRRRLQRIGTVTLFFLMLFIMIWFCWVMWVERYIVYSREGATIDFSLSASNMTGEVASPPVVGDGPEIYYNEGANAVNTSTEMTQLIGYYITPEMISEDLDTLTAQINTLPANTPVMIDMKGGYGSFYYNSELSDAIISQSVNVAEIDALVELMQRKNLYLIARIPAFRDYSYALAHVASGIPYKGGGGALWVDNNGHYWLKPTDSAVLGWISSIVLELRGMGFDEVVLSDFAVPQGERVVYDGDRNADILAAANTIMTNCATSYFTVSFTVSDSTATIPEGRCRMYLSNVAPKDVERSAATATVADPQIRLVFIADTNDTRYEQFGVLRPLNKSDVLNAEE